MITTQEILQNFVHIGALLYFVCFLFRNQILLRSFAMAGDLSYLIYYLNAADKPLWSAIYWNLVILLLNGVMLVIIIRDNSSTTFTENELKLYSRLKSISPPDFRKFARLGKWHQGKADTILTAEGQPINSLHYILEGELLIEKSGRKIKATPPMFVGEISFVTKDPASATVSALPDTLYISWSYADLTRALSKNDSLRNAIALIINADWPRNWPKVNQRAPTRLHRESTASGTRNWVFSPGFGMMGFAGGPQQAAITDDLPCEKPISD